MASEGELTRVGVYHRTLPISGARVWENARDWEHLPWLHSGSFTSIECLDDGDWGWRARIGTAGGAQILLELVIEDDEPRYVSRTLEGQGAGTEIWTSVDARSEDETRVEVEFWLPDVRTDRAPALALVFVNLYTRLWDEDESMMVRRAAELAAREKRGAAVRDAVRLGRLPDVKSRLPLIADFGGEPFRIVECEAGLVAHAVVCPHRLGPLDRAAVEDGKIECPWHGYKFDVATGRECTGRRMRLATPPRVEVDAETQQVTLEPIP